MCMTISLPGQLASRSLTLVLNRERLATIARLLEQEFAQRESALEQACLNQSTRDSYTRCPRRTDITRLCVLPVCQCCVV
jgi:hypothetical protein